MANMIFRQLTTSGDWTFGAGTSGFAQAEQAINLNVQTLIKSWQGDCFFDLQAGINWKGLLNVGQQKNLNAALQNLLAAAYGVVQVRTSAVAFDPFDRSLTATYTVDTVYTQNVVSQVSILSNNAGS